jgi:type II secretory pathway pseudopilin PulG
MKTIITVLFTGLVLSLTAAAKPAVMPAATLVVNEISYTARLADDEARFTLNLDAESAGTGESSINILAGDVAVLPPQLPAALKIVRDGNRYFLVASRAGHFKFSLEVVAKIQHDEPWNQVSFTGPAATIASIAAQANGTNTEVQLLNGTLLENFKTDGVSGLKGFLGADQTVALRWQGKVTAVARPALLTADSTITALVTPTVIKYTGKFHYDIVQGSAAQLTLTLPASQALTKIEGEQIRDWHTTADGDHQTLTVEFIKPVENAYDLTIYSEQPVESATENSALNPPQPLGVERESGSLTVSAEDTLVEVAALNGLRQVNAPDNAVVAYRFNERPFTLVLKLKHIEPVITVTDRVNARLEETRLVVTHTLALDVEKAGVYSLELLPQAGFAVADVQGDGIEDWKIVEDKLVVNFSQRALGQRQFEVQLEQALKIFPEQISIAPLRVTGAAKEISQIGVAAVPGIRLKTGSISGLSEIPINQLPDRGDEILAYAAESPDWQLAIGTEKLAARVVADVFNLVTIGDGLVGGSATIRYGLVSQGVQEFKVRVPANCKNVEFTGSNIRRKEQSGDVWTIGLQDKVWSGYTLVVTYDYPFDSKGATLPIGGIHAVGVERETGSIAITTAASLQLAPQNISDTLWRVDETELSAADRSLVTRAVVLAWQYSGDQYDLNVDVKRFAEAQVLEAVADRTQITSVLTEAGEMLTQASFMVKNNEKQFQRFQLPRDAKLWACYVNGQPVKPESDGDWVLVSLPRDENRDQAFTVDIMYAQTNGALAGTFGKNLELNAPRTDVPNTYAEWQIFVPPTLRLSDFGGSMSITQGTTYELLDAWKKFLGFYGEVLREAGGAIFFIGFLALLVFALVISAARRGWNGIITLFAVVAIIAVLGAMLLPALSAAKHKAQSISSVNNLRQIGLAVRIFSGDNNDRLPASFEEMKDELGSDKITSDPATGQRYTYLGGGQSLDSLKPDSVLAYSAPDDQGRCAVLFADGGVEVASAQRFAELSQRGLVLVASPQELAEKQREAVNQSQFGDRRPIDQTDAIAAPAAVASAAGMVLNRANTFAGSVGSGNFSGSISGNATIPAAPTAQPTVVSGIRSIRIALPQTGQPFLFTKVLNIHGEPLSIRANVIRLSTFKTMQMLWQSAAFLLGLVVWWTQWHRAQRNSFVLTLALALMLGSVCSLLIQWRALHDALIIGFPMVLVAVIALLVWKYWPRGSKVKAEEKPSAPSAPAMPDSGLPPVLASIAIAILFAANSATAADSPATTYDSQASIVSANYSGTVNDSVAALDATLQFSGAKAGETVALFGDDVAVQEFTVKSGRATLVRDREKISIRFDRGGDPVLQIKMLVKISGDVTKRKLAFAIPPALTSQISLVLNQPEADVDFPGAISFKRSLNKDTTEVAAVMGSADSIELLWTPRVKRAEEVAATIFCRNAALATFGGGVMNLRATLDYQITQGELRQARVQLPAGQKLLRVEGADIRTWEIKNIGGAQILVVDLMKGIPLGWQLTVETEKSFDALPASADVELPHALDVKREDGLVALRGTEELGLSVESAIGLERVDAAEFTRTSSENSGELASVFRFASPEFSLRVRAEAVQPQIEAVMWNQFRVSAEQVALSATVNYTIKRAGVFSLNLRLPDGYRVERVVGENIQQQDERNDAGGRVLEVTLKDRTSGAYTLSVELTRSFKELPESLVIAGVHPLGTAKLTGFIAVSAEPGVAVKTDAFDGLTEIPPTALDNNKLVVSPGNLLAYKFISSEPKALPEWNLTVATETVAAWVSAQTVNTFTLAETLVSGRALVRYEIANAPVKELRVAVPAEFRNVEISGLNIRSRERVDGSKLMVDSPNPSTINQQPSTNFEVWRVELQSPVSGDYTLTVTWDEPRSAKTNSLELAGVAAKNVERETGYFVVSAKAPLQVSEVSAPDLQPVDAADLPDWANVADSSITLAYRYAKPGARLALDVRRFDDAAVLEALVESANFTSVVADDGQMMTELALSVRNNGRQFLEVELPADAQVWSAFVAGQPVRPSVRDGKLLLPIQSSDAAAMTVELTYVGTNYFPQARGEVGFASPKFDVPLQNAHWEIYLPPDYNYVDLQKGTMTRELAPVAEPLSSSFSILDYSRMEQVNVASAKSAVSRDVSAARQQLAGGNVREATADFSRAKAKFYADKDEDAEVKKLGDDLKTAQASNLVNAQNEFFFRNAGQLSADASASGQTPLNYNLAINDSATAGEQWTKLQQAQEIVTAKIQPLRVNLPARGQRFEFTQVLQTEGGKPMTFVLAAENAKMVHWPSRLGAGLAAFLMLWAMVSVLSRGTQNRNVRR